jgi:hypothetical protein
MSGLLKGADMELTKKETETLRALFWAFQEAQGALNRALNETALAHGANLETERWNASSDFKRLEKIK